MRVAVPYLFIRTVWTGADYRTFVDCGFPFMLFAASLAKANSSFWFMVLISRRG
jgi:hypothetical protein